MTRRLHDELLPEDAKERIGTDDDGIRALSFRVGERRIDLVCVACFDDLQLPAERVRRLLRRFRLAGELRHVRVH